MCVCLCVGQRATSDVVPLRVALPCLSQALSLAGLELLSMLVWLANDPPRSAFSVLRLQAQATMPGFFFNLCGEQFAD